MRMFLVTVMYDFNSQIEEQATNRIQLWMIFLWQREILYFWIFSDLPHSFGLKRNVQAYFCSQSL